jgi:hypothetical protein
LEDIAIIAKQLHKTKNKELQLIRKELAQVTLSFNPPKKSLDIYLEAKYLTHWN